MGRSSYAAPAHIAIYGWSYGLIVISGIPFTTATDQKSYG